jgi:hypothetical protein
MISGKTSQLNGAAAKRRSTSFTPAKPRSSQLGPSQRQLRTSGMSAVYQPGIGVECEDDWLVGRKQLMASSCADRN